MSIAVFESFLDDGFLYNRSDTCRLRIGFKVAIHGQIKLPISVVWTDLTAYLPVYWGFRYLATILIGKSYKSPDNAVIRSASEKPRKICFNQAAIRSAWILRSFRRHFVCECLYYRLRGLAGHIECIAGTMIARVLGPRYQQLAKNWAPVLATWGSVGAVGLIWATDWRLFLDYVPYVSGKFKDEK
ncbi:hypothetical protein XELAEV_18006192mg [Xenopus laevis]|uniref:Cytochrome b-c1 complex subunit 10 n=2 Tax=Xenopus laevis TaxID=8355 RepID=A0A974DZ53_XENLA|nr:hypothetical protein XELAEV_18006192mg [Xenopus laevis]